MPIKRVLVVGAACAVGLEIVRALRSQHISVLATYRTHKQKELQALSDIGADLSQLDLRNEDALRTCLSGVDGVIFVPILTASKGAADVLSGGQHAVFFSSNNVAIDPENNTYAALLAAEKHIKQQAPQATILRPTMIYGYPGDGNLSRLMKAMQRYPIIPFPAPGPENKPSAEKGLQQPVYYKDLAEIAVQALVGAGEFSGTHAVAGPKAISQRALYAEVAKASDRKPLFLGVPVLLAARGLRLIERLGGKFFVSSAQLERVGRDKTPAGSRVLVATTSLSEGLEALAKAGRHTP